MSSWPIHVKLLSRFALAREREREIEHCVAIPGRGLDVADQGLQTTPGEPEPSVNICSPLMRDAASTAGVLEPFGDFGRFIKSSVPRAHVRRIKPAANYSWPLFY